MNRYYEVTAKCGHVGRGKYTEVDFYVKAINGSEAASKVRLFPRVKRDHPRAISRVRQITASEFMEGRNRNNQNPYLQATSVQEQRRNCDELVIVDGDWRKDCGNRKLPRSEKRLPLKIKDPWKYHKYYGFYETGM